MQTASVVSVQWVCGLTRLASGTTNEDGWSLSSSDKPASLDCGSSDWLACIGETRLALHTTRFLRLSPDVDGRVPTLEVCSNQRPLQSPTLMQAVSGADYA